MICFIIGLKDSVIDVHLHGSFAVTYAAWPYLQKQKYGRIIMTTSAAGLYGNFGQANYSAAKMALIGFSKSLAFEGSKNNITCNIIAPLAVSRISETAFPPELLSLLKPEAIAPVVAYLVHETTAHENGSVFETAGGFISKVRYQRSSGVFVNVEESNPTPISDLLAKFSKIGDFSTNPIYPLSITETPWIDFVSQSSKVPKKASGKEKDDKILIDQVVIVTGAGGGLGKAYALRLSALGATILVNDLDQKAAMGVVSQIRNLGGKAEANFDNVISQGSLIVQHALRAFGKLDVIINNAGILRDKSFAKQTPETWKLVIDVHLRGTFSLCHAAWPIFMKQKYGRIINTTSAVGLYGNFGQSNYSAAKAGIIGLSKSLAIEGSKHNIKVNIIAPNAGTSMTATIMPDDVVQILKPDYVTPLVAVLASKDHCQTNGAIFEVGSGWFSMVRIQRSGGVSLGYNLSISDISKAWPKIISFQDSASTFPTTIQNAIEPMIFSIQSFSRNLPVSNDEENISFSYTERDLILYALGIGCNENQLNWVYERDPNFEALPTFGVIPGLSALFSEDGSGPANTWINAIPKFNLMSLLHGEQVLEIVNPIPKKAILKSQVSVVSVQQKGQNSAFVVLRVVSRDSLSGQVIFNNETTLVIKGVQLLPNQTFHKEKEILLSKLSTSSTTKKIKKSYQTKTDQAVLYRLSGDLNPLHIDPSMAKLGGFNKPILHGLCTFGIAGRHILEAFNTGENLPPMELKMIRGRFSRPVLPGDTIVTNIEVLSSSNDKETHITFTLCTTTNSAPVLNNGQAILIRQQVSKEKTSSIMNNDHTSMSNSLEAVEKMATGWKLLSEASKMELITKVSNIIFIYTIL